jgi:iron complex transport system ATP-binding protein
MRDLSHPLAAPLLQTISLSVHTPDRAARALVSDLHWQVEARQCWCVIGRNGAGKSSLLRSLVGARKPDAGSVQMNGKPLANYRLGELAQLRAYLPQGRTDAFAYSVLETVLSTRFPYADVHYWDNAEQIAHAKRALQQLDVTDLAQRDIRSLSGGERQRVAIAATIAQETPLLLLDEPTSALDLAHQVSVMQLLSTLYRQQNKAIIMVSHDLNLSHQLASHALLLMGDGRYLAGPKEQVMTSAHLSACLGQWIERIQHQERVLFLPVK